MIRRRSSSVSEADIKNFNRIRNKEDDAKRHSLNLQDRYKSGSELTLVGDERLDSKRGEINNKRFAAQDRSLRNLNNSQNKVFLMDESDEDYEEFFDPSLIFVSMYKCYFWNSKGRIRQGKIFLTKSELLFKCSRMPFFRLRIFLRDIIAVKKIKHYKNGKESVLSVDCKNFKSHIFYKFRIPKSIVKNNILKLMQSEEIDADEPSQNCNPNSFNINNLKGLSRSISDLKIFLKPRNRNSFSESKDSPSANSNDIFSDQIERTPDSDTIPKSDVESKPITNRPRSLRILKNSISTNVINDDQTNNEKKEKKISLFIKRKKQFTKSERVTKIQNGEITDIMTSETEVISSPDNDYNANNRLNDDTKHEKKDHLYFKNTQKKIIRSESFVKTKNGAITDFITTETEAITSPEIEYKNILNEIKSRKQGSLKLRKHNAVRDLEQEKKIQESEPDYSVPKRISSPKKSQDENEDKEEEESEYSDDYNQKSSYNRSWRPENNIINYENTNLSINQTQLNNGSKFLMVLFLISMLTFVLMTAVNIYKLFHLERSILKEL